MIDPFFEPLDNEIDTGYGETHMDLLADMVVDIAKLKAGHRRAIRQREITPPSSPNDLLDCAIAGADAGDYDPLTPGEAFGFADEDEGDDDNDDTSYGSAPVE